jgi:ABC-type transporter Mla subunit MlaD
MRTERNELAAGIFIIASAVAIGAIVVAIKGATRITEPSESRQVSFRLTDDLSGLRRGDDVRLGGFKVGLVQSIDVVTADPSDGEPRIIVEFTLPSRYKLHANSLVSVQSGITGSPSLNIERLGGGDEVKEVAGQPGAFSTLTSALRGVTPELVGIVHDVHTVTVPRADTAIAAATHLVRHVDEQIDPVVDRYGGLTKKAGSALDQVNGLFGDTRPDIRATLANLHVATGTLRERLPSILDRVQNSLDTITATVDNARGIMADVKATAANTNAISASVRSLLVDNRGKIDSMISSFKATSENLKEATIEIRRSPWRLLYKPGPDEMANLNLYDSARAFADGAGTLDDAAMALRDSLKDPNADPAKVKKLLSRLDDSFANFKLVEDKLWQSVK